MKTIDKILFGTFVTSTLATATAGIVFESDKYAALAAIPMAISTLALGGMREIRPEGYIDKSKIQRGDYETLNKRFYSQN